MTAVDLGTDADAFAALAALAESGPEDLPLYPPLDLAAVERDVYEFVATTRLVDPAQPLPLPATSQLSDAARARLVSIVTSAVATLEAAVLEYHAPPPRQLGMSFNGGKDCTVLLHMLAAVLHRHARLAGVDADAAATKLITVHVAPANGFPEEAAFVAKCAARYRLHMVTVAGPMQAGLAAFHAAFPAARAVCVGTRRTDPWCAHLAAFQPCDVDKGWPDLVRVNPILDWRFADIWLFLLALRVEYCPLYDLGYTSLGARDRTVPNPALRVRDDEFLPAWRLVDGSLERAGRLPAPPAKAANGAA
ncbi:3'-phosphoadenosine 5'-phosphosulfate sulfotransferase [Blastocladiella emersonii ATCC 22665]|nr:3'-phosphoadenosine 5'-phosphosulfate sulfotransferase [Blastocladiella emersonii ATCC 22665]